MARPDEFVNRSERETAASLLRIDRYILKKNPVAEAVARAAGHYGNGAHHVPQPEAKNGIAGDLTSVQLICGASIKPEPIKWLWPGWLALGKLHVIGGIAGSGKTTLALAVAATITSAGRWPDASRAEGGSVLIWSGEDDPADTLVPRLLAMGADLSRVHFVSGVLSDSGNRAFDPAVDMPGLILAAAAIKDLRLMILDPIVNAVAGDGHKNGDVHRGLAPVVDFAASIGCAVLGITHFTKGTAGREPIERVTGSLAFGALARVVMVAAKIKEDDGTERRIIARAKSNIGPDDGGYAYRLEQIQIPNRDEITASVVYWGEALPGTARQLLATVDADPDEIEGDSVASVLEWLRDLLKDEGGQIDRRDVMKAAKAMGHKERTVHRARKKLGLEVRQTGFGRDKRSMWALVGSHIPANPASIVPIVPGQKAGTDGTNSGTHDDPEVF